MVWLWFSDFLWLFLSLAGAVALFVTIPRGLMFSSVKNLLQISLGSCSLIPYEWACRIGRWDSKKTNLETSKKITTVTAIGCVICVFFFLKWPFQKNHRFNGRHKISHSFYKLWEITTNSSIHNNPWCCLASRLTSIASIWSLQKWKNVPWIKKKHSKTTSLERTN